MYVTLNYQPLDVRSILGSRWYIRKVVPAGATMELDVGKFSAYSSQVGGLGISFATSAANTRYTGGNDNPMMGAVSDGVSTDTHKPRSVNFPVEVAYMNGWIQYVNQPRPGIPLNAEQQISIVGDGEGGGLKAPPEYSQALPSPLRSQVAIDLTTGKEATGGTGGGGPTIDRVQVAEKDLKLDQAPAGISPDGTPNPVYDDALLEGISRTDFANTDIHVFGPGGDLVSSRIGLRQSESPGLTCDTGEFSPAGTPICKVTESNPAAFTPIADFIRNRYPGARYKVIVVNRSTGYVGTGFVRVGGDGLNGLQAYEVEGDAGPRTPIFMRPPNLKVEVKRVPKSALGNDVCHALAPGVPCEQLVGFEGGGLADDQYISISTEWLDWDGAPLPASLPGFTGRLSRVTEEGKLVAADSAFALKDPNRSQASGSGSSKRAGDLSHFQIRPNAHLQVVRLGGDASAYHYYLHLSGANGERCGKATGSQAPAHESWEWFTENSPACASFAQEVDAQFQATSDSRPSRFVPIRVPVFDAASTAGVLQLQIEAARQQATANPNQLVRVPKVEPIYTYVYRPEAQFSIYDLKEFTSPELVTKYDADRGSGKTTLSFGYDLSTTGKAEPLPTYGSAKDPTWSLGFEELVALVNGENDTASWDDLETLLALSPAQQLNEVQNAASKLSPQDYLALQLYLGNDRGNPLYVDYDVPFPLVHVDVAPLTLKRRENLTRFGSGVVSPPPVQDDFKPIQFEVTAPACLTIRATPHQQSVGPAPSVELFAKAPLAPSTYYYLLDGGELAEKGVRGNFTLEFIAETCGTAVDGGSDGESQFRVHRSEIEVSQQTLRSNRGLGEIVEHDVNVLDGSLRLSRQDFSLGGKGPALALMRSYTNLGTDSDGALGNGWSHSFDLQLVPTSTQETGNLSVPSWVSELRSEVTPCPNGQCMVAQKLFPTQAVQLTGVYVNGTSFRHLGQQRWAAESGRHSELIQHCAPEAPTPECFEFKSKDGTSYLYDYPAIVAPVDGQKDPNPTMLGLQDGLAQRSALFNLRYRQPNTQQGQGGAGMEPTPVRRIKDRFEYELEVTSDETRRVATVTERDRGSAGRTCRFVYDAASPDAPVGCADPGTGFERLRSLMCLENRTSTTSGELEIKVDYCYDADGNLASVQRGRHVERYEYEREGGSSPDAAEEGGNPNLVATVVDNEQVEQRTTYAYKQDTAPHTFTSGALPQPIALLDMVESVTYPATEPMPGQDARAEITFDYDGMTRTVGDARGPPHEGRKYTLNTLGNPSSIEEAGRKTTTMQWSFDVGSSPCGPTTPGDNQMVSRSVELEEGRSVTTTFAYDAGGNVTDECTDTEAGSLRTEQTWNNLGQLELRKDFRGVEESWDYENNGFLKSHTDGAGITTEYAPSSEHRGRAERATVRADVTQITEYRYDALGNVSSAAIAGGAARRSSYDARSRLERQTDQLDRVTTYEYDTNDNLRFTRLPLVGHAPSPYVVETIEATYDAVGNKKTENDRNGLKLTYQYTARNQVKSVTRTTIGPNGGAHSRLFKYDLLGNLRQETDWKGVATLYEYDLLGFRRKTIDREGHETTTDRDYAGNVVLLTDAGSPALATRIRYDELNREVWRKPQCGEPDCGPISTAYPLAPEVDGPGVVYSVRVMGPGAEANGQVTTRSGYDGRGLLVVKLDVYSNRYEWSYDALGRLKRTKDEEGIVTTQRYDARGFLSEKRVHGRSEANPGLFTEFTADGVGNVLFTKVHRGSAGPALVTGAKYDNWNRVVTRSAPGSSTEDLHYDGEGNVVRHKDAGGRVRGWERDQRGNVVHFYDAEVKARTAGQASTATDQSFTLHYAEIDANDNPHKVVNALGVATRYAYDDEERVTSITEAEGSSDARIREFRQIDGLGNPHAVTDWRGNATELTYTARHNVRTEKDPLARFTTYSYDGQGNQASVKTARDFVRTFKRDNLGRVTDVSYPSATTLESHNDYDKVGNLRKTRDRRNSVTHFEPDQYLRVEHVRKSMGDAGALTRIQTNEYDDAGNVTATIDGNGNRTTYEFNARNLLWKTIVPAVLGESEADRTEVREYTASGALFSVTSPGGSGDPALVTTFAHDKEDRSIGTTAVGEATTSSYDLLGNLRAQTMPEGQPGGKYAGKFKRFEYDDVQRLTRVTDEVGLSTKYGYDKAGNLRDVEGPFAGTAANADTPHIGYVYNAKVDRLEEHLQYRKSGGALITHFDGFDDHDNVTHLVDANGSGFTYRYDEYDRRVRATYPNKPTALNEPKEIAWDFDDAANTVTITETKKGPSGSDLQDVTLERYDLLFGRLDSRRQRGHEVSYAYDTNGNRTRVTSPQGTTTYTFDARNRVETAIIGSATSTYRYHSDGRVRSITRPNDTTTSLAYYPTRRVHQITHQFAGGEDAVVAYTYDKNGNRTSVGDTRSGLPDVTTFDEYDAAGRLLQFTQDNRVTRYGYDRYNRQSENVKENGVTQVNKVYGYDELERLNTLTDDAQAPVTVNYGYDANGNTLSRTISNAPADRADFEYDSRDQLVRMTRGPPGSVQTLGRYDYDSEGKRTRHEDSERGSVEYIYDDEAIIEERLTPAGDPPQTRVTRYHYGQDLLAIAEDAGTRYYHQDGLGSTTQLSDGAGLTTVEYKTDPFGNVRLSEGDTDNRQTFTGQEYDERTGLYYYGARYYDPVVGRFLTQDSYLGEPGTPASLHRYLYAYSNPLAYGDSTGHWPEWLDKWRQNGTNIEANPVFRMMSDRGKGLFEAPKVIGEAAGDAAWRVTEAYQKEGVLGAYVQTRKEEFKAYGAVLQGAGHMVAGTGKAIWQVNKDIVGSATGIGKDRIGWGTAANALDAGLNLVDIGLLCAGGAGVAKSVSGGAVQGSKLAAVTRGTGAILEEATGLGRTALRGGGEAAQVSKSATTGIGRMLPAATEESLGARLAAVPVNGGAIDVSTSASRGAAAMAVEVEMDAAMLRKMAQVGQREVGGRGSVGAMMDPAYDVANTLPRGRTILSNEVGSGIAKEAAKGGQFTHTVDSVGRTTEVTGRITGPHPLRPKGPRPEPFGGRAPGHHRGHLVPENAVDNPGVVNVRENIISEAAGSNLGPKRVFENEAMRVAQQHPDASVIFRSQPVYRGPSTVPHAVSHYVEVNGEIVRALSILNK